MEVKPDFGYEGDNFILEEEEGAPRNWELLAEIVSCNKHEWLKNHIELRHIRRKQEEEEVRKKLRLNLKLQLQSKIIEETKVETGETFHVKKVIIDDFKALEQSAN